MGKETISLVAGAAGFIGSHLSETLLKKGKKVIGVDNFVTGSANNIQLLSNYNNFSFIEHNIATPLDISEKIDFVYDFACPASPTDFEKLRMQILYAGCFGTYFLLELAREHNSTFVLSSSSEVYGDALENPQQEEYTGNVNTLGVRSIYDEGKRYGESMAMTFHREYGLRTRIVRIFNTFGERMRANDGRAIPTFINQAIRNEDITIFGDGHQTRSPQYVSDLVNGVIKLAKSEVTLPVNMGNPTEMSMLDLAETIIRLAKSKSKLIFDKPLPEHDPKVRCPDIKRAKKLIDWEPKVDVEDGLLRTIEWFRKENKEKE